MAIKGRLPLLLFLSCVFLAFVSLSLGYDREDPRRELDACVSKCGEESDMYRYLSCRRSCELRQRGKDPEGRRRGEEQKEREREEWQREQEGRQRREEKGSQQREREEEKRRREEQEREDERRRREEQQRERGRGEEQPNQQQRENPYYFQSQKFQSRFRNPNGQYRVLPKFDRTSNRLRGLKNYRFAVYEARPHTVSIPHHSDADFILIVARGNATVTFINKSNRESYNLDQTDVLRVPAGSTALIVNRNNNENLRIIKLVNPVNNPGEFEDFFAGGRDNPQSYLRVFSEDVLQASFNRPLEEIERTLFGEQQREQQGRRRPEHWEESEQGFIVKAPEEYIRALSQKASSTKGGKSTRSGPFNLFRTKPEFSNEFGRFFEAHPDEFQQLRDLDVSVTAAEIQQGAVMLPHFNSRTTVLAFVIEGTASIEIACPHAASQKGQQSERGAGTREEEEDSEQAEWRSGQIERVQADVSPGDLVVIPAGHPFAIRASKKQNLRLVGFGVDAQNNQRNFVAGSRDNVLSQLEKEEQDLSFSGRGQEVERLFKGQRESYFARPNSQRRQEGSHGPLSSLLSGFL